ncbi:pyruvate kinase [Sulfurimonas aquatica]|uniref:Pyruvate kinase n=1 Tax=Sulfurimonas aquatica TaxID=2672570 RepID=A0A975AZM0_9BACT|nr:pyruvate kinase [Sulfurimonas aquatica]QSZ41418.1 pyruvate kinase [Sulfurimonas aquatica]
MKKRTKILATIGPASDSLETLVALIKAGVNVFRLNFSHGTHEQHSHVLKKIKKAMEVTGLIVGVLQDISGPKIRIGELEEDFLLEEGDKIIFTKEEIMGHKQDDALYRVCINYPQILQQLKIGDFIYLYDGIIRTKVSDISNGNVEVVVENRGILSSKKGVNFPNTRLGVDVLTQKDKNDMEWGVVNEVDFMAISFVQSAADMIKAREIIEALGGRQNLIAKIEKFDAIENIDAIIQASDGLMVARGDLGIEVPYYEVPNIQKMLINKANEASIPVITATQMLLSMTKNQRATRAEISDIANAVMDGTDAVMLSEESAVGDYPVLAVQTMSNTIIETEKHYNYYKFDEFKITDSGDTINKSAVSLSCDLNAKGIFSITSSGSSARKLARYRPKKTIYAITHDALTRGQMTLIWGVIPLMSVRKESLEVILDSLMVRGLENGSIKKKYSYILTAGDPIGKVGSTNMIRVISQEDMYAY